ncbi:hypothetical protein F4802DRAFT_116852 [Xylaria palmicola]|nr:hypothetical protein F4802DRAFT_116852 [Xylaria palmicola]
MMASPDNVVRNVGSHAKYNTARHSLGILRAVIVTCRYRTSAAHLRRQSLLSLHDAVENAVAAVVLEQAMLRVGIVGEDTREPAFVHLKTIDMRRMIEWKPLGAPTAPAPPSARAGTDGREEEEGQGGETDGEDEEEARYEDRLLRSLERYHGDLWDDLASKPGWKVVVHHDPRQLDALGPGHEDDDDDAQLSLDVSFCFHHAYSDGLGGYIFHGALRRALNDPPSRPAAALLLQDHVLHLPTPPALPPAMDALVPFSLSWAFVLRTVWAEILHPTLRRLLRVAPPTTAALPWTGGPVDPSSSSSGAGGTRIRVVCDADGPALARILARCRARGASLTGLLHALVARSLGRAVLLPGGSGSGSGEASGFRSTTPISLARCARADHPAFAPGETIHCLVTALTCDHDAEAVRRLLLRRHDDDDTRGGISAQEDDDDEAVWAFARDMTTRLRARTAELPRDDVQGLAGLVGDWHAFFRARFGRARESSWELSNLGSLTADDEDDGIRDQGRNQGQKRERERDEGQRWTVDRAVFTQGSNATSAAICFNVAGVAGRGVCVTASWQDGVVDVSIVEAVVRELRACITKLGEA